MTTTNDIERKRGDTRRITFKVKDSDGAVIDITSWTEFKLTINSNKSPANTDDELDELSGVILDGLAGRVYFVPSGAIDVGSYFYDVQALDENSEKITFSEGKYKLTQDIGKA